jgi:hypothetical protein
MNYQIFCELTKKKEIEIQKNVMHGGTYTLSALLLRTFDRKVVLLNPGLGSIGKSSYRS